LSLITLALGFWVFAMLIIINQHQAELNGLSGGSSFAIVGGISALLVRFSLSPLVSTGGSAPDVLSRWPFGANPPVSISVSPSQSWLSLRCPERDLRSTVSPFLRHDERCPIQARGKVSYVPPDGGTGQEQILKTEDHVAIPPMMYSDSSYRITYASAKIFRHADRAAGNVDPIRLWPARFICSGTNAGRRWTCYNERYNAGRVGESFDS
jgi:hypothetical protein